MNKQKKDAVIAVGYDLSKKIPDMRLRGVRIDTSYGELELNEQDGAKVTDLVERLLVRKLAKLQEALA